MVAGVIEFFGGPLDGDVKSLRNCGIPYYHTTPVVVGGSLVDIDLPRSYMAVAVYYPAIFQGPRGMRRVMRFQEEREL